MWSLHANCTFDLNYYSMPYRVGPWPLGDLLDMRPIFWERHYVQKNVYLTIWTLSVGVIEFLPLCTCLLTLSTEHPFVNMNSSLNPPDSRGLPITMLLLLCSWPSSAVCLLMAHLTLTNTCTALCLSPPVCDDRCRQPWLTLTYLAMVSFANFPAQAVDGPTHENLLSLVLYSTLFCCSGMLCVTKLVICVQLQQHVSP